MLKNLSKIVGESDSNYVDLSAATAFKSSISKGCLTVVNCDSPRIQLSKELVEDIGNPETVQFLMIENQIAIMPASDENQGLNVCKNNYIYCAELARSIIEICGKKIEGSQKMGSYHLQQVDDDTVAAIVSLN